MDHSMDVIKWRKSYETGIADMDEEHKKIIEVVNRLYKMLRGVDESGDLKDIYEVLEEYSERHFKHEEELLRNNGYPGVDEQGDSHAEFIAKLREIRSDLEANDASAIPGIYKYLREWWIGHIVDSDMKYGPFLKGNGV